MSHLRMDTKLLICSIEERNCLWDVFCEEYKNKDIKNKAYRDVAEILIKDFKELTEKEQEEAVLLVKKRWKTARDAYVRDRAKMKKIKSGDAAKSVKKNIFFDNLKFLDQTMDLNRTETSLGLENTERESTGDFATLEHEEDEEIPTFQNTHAPNPFPRQKRKKKESLDDKLIAFLNESSKADQDDHRAFLVSLLPTLKTFNETQTLQFRSEVLRLVMEIKNIKPRPISSQVTPAFNKNSPSFSRSHQYNYFRENLSPPQQNQPLRTPSSSCQTSGRSSASSNPFSLQDSEFSPQNSLLSPIDTQFPIQDPRLLSASITDTSYHPTLLELCGQQIDDPLH